MIVDDHEVVRMGYATLLRSISVYDVVADSGSVQHAYSALQRAEELGELPDILITDLNLGGVSGLELISKTLDRFAAIKILAVSMHENGALVQRVLDLGAHGYFCKSGPPSALKLALETIAAGRIYLDDTAQQALSLHQRSKQRFETLTRREYEILQQVVKGESYLSIGKSLSLSGKTIANHLSTIRGKFDVQTDFQLMRLVDQLGMPLL
jgi:two-component system, NarL family, invasion response regulator UvrY